MPSANDLVLLDRQLCFLLYASSRAMTKAYQPMLNDLGLTYPQYLVLMVLWEWHDNPPEEPTVKALGRRLMLDSGTLTPLLKRLEKQELIRRERDKVDERRVFLQLTRQGVALRPRAVKWLSGKVDNLAFPDGFVEQLHSNLRQLLDKISDDSSYAL